MPRGVGAVPGMVAYGRRHVDATAEAGGSIEPAGPALRPSDNSRLMREPSANRTPAGVCVAPPWHGHGPTLAVILSFSGGSCLDHSQRH